MNRILRNRDVKLAVNFRAPKNRLEVYPSIGRVINGWKLCAAWVNEYGTLMGYLGRCTKCNRVKDYIAIPSAVDRSVRKCKYCNTSGRLFKLITPDAYARLVDEFGLSKVKFAASRFSGILTRGTAKDHPGIDKAWKEPNKGFENFFLYAKTVDGFFDPKFVIDRIDTYKGYAPGNIRFTTPALNACNTKRNLMVKLSTGGQMPLGTWCRLMEFSTKECATARTLWYMGFVEENELLLRVNMS